MLHHYFQMAMKKVNSFFHFGTYGLWHPSKNKTLVHIHKSAMHHLIYRPKVHVKVSGGKLSAFELMTSGHELCHNNEFCLKMFDYHFLTLFPVSKSLLAFMENIKNSCQQ